MFKKKQKKEKKKLMPEQTREKMTHVHFPLVDNVEVIPFITCGDRSRERDRLSQSHVTSGLLTPPPFSAFFSMEFLSPPLLIQKKMSRQTLRHINRLLQSIRLFLGHLSPHLYLGKRTEGPQ